MGRRLSTNLIPVIAIAAMVGVQCARKGQDPVASQPPPSFPLTLGSYWNYEIERIGVLGPDTSIRYDTVSATITDTVRMTTTGQLATMWTWDPAYPNIFSWYHNEHTLVTSTHTTSRSPDTLRFYYSISDSVPWQTFILPAEPGDQWVYQTSDILYCDSARVVSDSAIDTPVGTISDAVEVKYLCTGFEGYWFYRHWVSPHTGIVHAVHSERGLCGGGGFYCNSTKTWRLLSYHIAAP